jgi:GT2 family glycosyltransferase
VIYILVPTFARLEDTKRFLNSIHKSIESPYKILLIDDHPDKITYKNVDEDDEIEVITSNKELWWVGSINLGIQNLFEKHNLKDDDFVIFANNDVQIDKDSFNALHAELLKNNKQIVHPRTIDHNGFEVSSGAKIYSFFPYITKHPKNFLNNKQTIDMGTARFLMMSGYVLNEVGFINDDLVQYGGDNDFTLSARRYHSIYSYIIRDSICILQDTHTGIKNHKLKNVSELYNSFFSIRSPNNIKYRYIFFKKFFGKIFAFFIVASLIFNTLFKYFFYIKRR